MSQTRALPLVPIQNPESVGDLQRVAAVPSGFPHTSAPSSKNPDRQDSRLIGIQNLLDPLECKGDSSKHTSPSLSKVDKGPLVSVSFDAHTLYATRSSPYRQQSQDAFYPQAHDCEHTRGVNPQRPQPASRGDSPSAQYSYCNRDSQTEPVISTPVASAGQPQYFPPSWSADPSSAMPQLSPGTKAFEWPISNTAAQFQYQMMVLETEQGSIQIPIDVQAASKVQDEKRKRNATVSHRFRQREKEKEREISEKIANLEAEVRETEEE